MKKLFLIIFCTFLFQVSVNAFTQDEAIKKYLSNKKLEQMEGIWLGEEGRIIVNYKQGNSYFSKVIYSTVISSGDDHINISSGSSKFYAGSQKCSIDSTSTSWGTTKTKIHWLTCRVSAALVSNNLIRETINYPPVPSLNWTGGSQSHEFIRIWPENFSAHNSKYGGNSKTASEKINPSSGTAFFVTDKGHLITNHHVVDGCEDKSKIVYKDKEYPAKLIAKDKLLDFALLKADISRNKFIVLSDEPPKKLQRIIAAGYPLGKNLSDDLKFTSGIISSLKGMDDDSTLIQIDAALNPGNSGGPIVDDKTGELVAVAVAGMRKDKTEAINFGIKTNSLKNFLDSNQIRTSGSKMLFSFGNTDVSNILEESTVYTFCK